MRVSMPAAEIGIYSSGREQIPAAQYIIDVGQFRDPYSSGGMRNQTKNGLDPLCIKYVSEDRRMEGLLKTLRIIAYLQLRAENTKSGRWLSFTIADHHGKWTAPAVAEVVTQHLSDLGYKVALYHDALKAPGRLDVTL